MVSSEELIYIGFNQDASCFTLSTEKKIGNAVESGFRILRTNPLKYCFQRGNP